MRILAVNSSKRIVELTLKELLVKGKKKMPVSANDDMVTQGRKMTGVVVSKNQNGLILKFYGDLKGFLRFENLKKHGPKLVTEPGHLLDVYLLFKT
jgi:ribosomal protein S1